MIESCTVFCCYNLHLFNMYFFNKALGIPNNKQEPKISTILHTHYYIGPVTNCVKRDTFILWVIVSTIMAWLLFMVN